MTPADFREARRVLGLSHRQMAAALGGIDPSTARRYAMEPARRSARPIPKATAELVRRLVAERLAGAP